MAGSFGAPTPALLAVPCNSKELSAEAMETTPPGTPRRDDAQHDAPPQDRPGEETPPQYRRLRERVDPPFAPQRSRSRSSSEESGLRVAVLPGPVDEGDVGGGDGGGDGGGGDGVGGGGNERAGRGKTIGVALFFLVNAVTFLAAWQQYTRPSHEVLELKDDGIEDFALGKFDVLENDATDHLWPLKPEWVGVGVGTSTDIIVGSITGLDELAGGSELTQQCDRCKKGDIKRPSGLDPKSYEMPDSGVAKMLPPTGPEAAPDSILAEILDDFAGAFFDLQEKCHVLDPSSPLMKYIKVDHVMMDSVDYAVVYYCYESKTMDEKGGRVTKSRAAYKERYLGENCLNVWVLDRMLQSDLAPLDNLYKLLPKKYHSMKPGKYQTITIKEALQKEKETGVSFFYTDVFLPMITGCKNCPWIGGHNLRGLQKGHHLNAMESGMQEALGITGGAMHEMLRAGGNMQWSADHGIDEINADIHNLFEPRLRQFQRGFTGDERSPDSFEESTFHPSTSGQSWAPTYASGDSIFSNAELFVAPVDEPDIADDEPDQQSYEEEEEKEGGDGAPASIHTKLYEATTTLCDYVYGVTDSASKRFHNGWRIWVDTFLKKADVSSAREEYSAADRGTSLSNVRKLLNAFTKTVGDPFKTFRIMNLNENKLTFEGKDYDMATLLTEEYGYQLLHTYRYVQVYWLENDDCQISLIFLHKPWHIAFQSYPLFGKGSRGHFSRQELAIMANMALTIEWQRTVWQGLVNGNIQRAEATQTAFGSVPSAFGLFVYCYRDAHLDPQVCAAIAKAAILVPRGVHPLLRETMKTKHVTKRERDAARGRSSGEERDILIRHTIQQCTTAPSAGPVDNAAKEAVETMIDPEGKKRTKIDVDKMIANLGRDQFKPTFAKKLQKEHNRQRKELESDREEADNKRERKKEDAKAEAMARMNAKYGA